MTRPGGRDRRGVAAARAARTRPAGARAPFRAALLGLLVAAGACAEPDGRVTLEFWAMGREGEAVRELVPEFERRHPGIRVEVQQIPWTAAHEKLLTAYVGDATPDVAQLGNTWVPEFVAIEALEPLDAWTASSGPIGPEAYFPGIWDTNEVDGRLYGVPWYIDTRVLFLRTDLMARAGVAEPPRTWAAWLEALRALKGLEETRWGILLPIDEWPNLPILAMQLGADLLRDGGRWADVTNPRFREAFAFYVGLFDEGLAPAVTRNQVANLYSQFAAGEFAMHVTGPWNIGEFRRRLPEEVQDDWTTAPLPAPGEDPPGVSLPATAPEGEGDSGVDRDYPGVSLAGGSSLVVFRGSERKQAARELVEYLSEPGRQARFYELTGDLPARTDAWREAGLAEDRYAAAFWEQLHDVRPTPKVPEWERIATAIHEHAELVIRGRRSREEALEDLEAAVNGILEKRRWMLEREE